MRLESVAFDARSLLEEAIGLFGPQSEERGLALTLAIDGDVPEAIVGDPERLRQILVNLIGNAIKFTETGSVTLRVDARRPEDSSDDARDVRFAVEDTGMGIEPEKLAGLFRAFAQADSSTTRRFGGTGLGLTIARDIARRQGGDITLRRSPLGGLRARVHLPQ